VQCVARGYTGRDEESLNVQGVARGSVVSKHLRTTVLRCR
jgi:hypothetical protein